MNTHIYIAYVLVDIFITTSTKVYLKRKNTKLINFVSMVSFQTFLGRPLYLCQDKLVEEIQQQKYTMNENT